MKMVIFMLEDINKVMILIVGKSPEEMEWMEKNPNFNRHIFYYRQLGQRKDGIFHQYIMAYDSTVPLILRENGYIFYQSLTFDMGKTKEAMLFVPNDCNEFQQEFLNTYPFETIPYLKKITGKKESSKKIGKGDSL